MRALAILFALLCPLQAQHLVFAGTYTRPGASQGIYAFRFDAASGRLQPLGLAAPGASPSFLAVHPNGRFLYASHESAQGGVSAFAIDRRAGKLTLLNHVEVVEGGSAHISVDRAGKNVLTAQYNGGSVAVLPIHEDGSLRPPSALVQHKGAWVSHPDHTDGPHAHSIDTSPDNRFAVAADLALDRMIVYRYDAAAGKLTPNNPPDLAMQPGVGPRHFAFHPGGKFAYAIHEMASTITAFSWDAARGALAELGTVSTLPAGFTGANTTAEIALHPSGKFVYGSNRGHDSIAVFNVDATRGTLTPAGHFSTGGKTPRHFAVHPAGTHLIVANQDSDNLTVFRIDARTGRLTPARATAAVSSPSCVVFVAVQ